MIKKIITLNLILFSLIYSSTINWALTDLTFAKKAILENHPGVYNHLDPQFCTNVDLFFNEAQAQLANAQDNNTRKQILYEFGKSFNDAHLKITFPRKTPIITPTTEQSKNKTQCTYSATDSFCFVRIPTFSPTQEENDKMQSIVNQMTIIRETPSIIFDVHGNDGGNSMWGKKITDALFGEEYTRHKRAQALAEQYVEWRASASNIEYLNTDLKNYIYKDFGKESNVAEWIEHIIDGMEKAYNIGDMLYRDQSNESQNCADSIQYNSLYTGTIIVIIDSHCVSACLDFIDELKLMGTKVILIGKKTMADSLYMECRSLPLPSGKGTLTIPIKVYRNRPRGHNVPYTPDIEYTQDINNTHDVLSYVNSNLLHL